MAAKLLRSLKLRSPREMTMKQFWIKPRFKWIINFDFNYLNSVCQVPLNIEPHWHQIYGSSVDLVIVMRYNARNSRLHRFGIPKATTKTMHAKKCDQLFYRQQQKYRFISTDRLRHSEWTKIKDSKQRKWEHRLDGNVQ